MYKQFYFLCMSYYFQVLPYSMSSLSFFLVRRTNARETKMTTRVTVGGRETGETLVPVASLPSLKLKKKRDCSQSSFTLTLRIFVCQVQEGSILVGFTVVPTSGGRDLNEFADDITAKVRAVQLLTI